VRDPQIDFKKFEQELPVTRPRSRRESSGRSRRSRAVALIVLILGIAVVLVVGVTTGRTNSSGGEKETVPFNLLPVTPQNLEGVTTTTPPTTVQPSATTPVTTGDAGTLPPTGGQDQVGGDAGPMTEVAATPSVPVTDVPVLAYHYVDDVLPPTGPYASGMTVRTADFKEQMQYLADHGYHTVSLGDLYVARKGLRSLPSKPIVLTFDDGGLDNYSVAFPILRAYGFTATFFVVTGKVGAAGHMDWEDLRTMMDMGMSIGSHTVSHPADLRTLDDSHLTQELVASRAAIAEHLGSVPEALSYPSGHFDQRVIASAKAAGYILAVSTNVGTDEGPLADFEIRRIRVVAFESLRAFSSSLR
jgi:peptidoglycan/xylan/chitin deacetylase (PgdA/CDA1 family)